MSRSMSSEAYRASLKGKVIHVAMSEFLRHGVSAVKMDDIAAALSISKRTLYEIFANKEDLLLAGMKAYMAKNTAKRDKAINEGHNVIEQFQLFYQSEIEMMSKVNPVFFSDMAKYPKVMAFRNQVHDETRQNGYNYFRRGIEEGLFRKDVDHMIVMQFSQAILDYFILHEVYKRVSVETIFQNVVLVILRGLCTEKGARQLDEKV